MLQSESVPGLWRMSAFARGSTMSRTGFARLAAALGMTATILGASAQDSDDARQPAADVKARVKVRGKSGEFDISFEGAAKEKTNPTKPGRPARPPPNSWAGRSWP